MRIKKPIFPSSAEREYLRNLKKYANAYVALMRQALKDELPDIREVSAKEQPRLDENIESKIARIIGMVDRQMTSMFPDALLKRWSMSMIDRVNKHTKKQINEQFVSQFSEEEPDFVGLMSDGKITPFFQNVIEENVGLIKSIPKLKQPAFKNALVSLITDDATSETISKVIQNHFNITKGRADLIARDQVGKLSGKLEEYRHKQLGIEEYDWMTSHDERVRDDHKRLDGKRFKYSNPPIEDRRTGHRGNPKSGFQCRCWARPVFPKDFGKP